MVCHVVAVPYPGRGHINPMMNLCKYMVSHHKEILITFVVTQEWQTLINTDHDHKPHHHHHIRISTIPNVLPSELTRGSDFAGFYEAVMTKMEAPFEAFLDQVETPVTLIIADTELLWAVPVANHRHVPVALLWTSSASVFSLFLHHDVFRQSGHLGIDLFGHGEERVEYIPGVSSIRKADLPTIFHTNQEKVLQLTLQCIERVKQAQYLLFNSIYEIEQHVIDILKTKYPFPLYTVGPTIPFFEININPQSQSNEPNYLQWLDSQPKGSVLYVSLGSFLSISQENMEELVAGVCDSGVKFLWVCRGGNNSLLNHTRAVNGFVVPWCDQLRVLCHSSIGGFLSHCGWNSVLEAMFAGVPILTFPVFFDQPPNSKQIVEDWKIGWQGKAMVGDKNVVMREEISRLVCRFMNTQSSEGRELRKRANEVKDVCRRAIVEGGSSVHNLNAFLLDVLQQINKCRD